MDLLKRESAPILPEAWAAIDAEARRVLAANLAGRKLVDLDGPHGWQLAAVNLGHLELFRDEPIPDVHVGKRIVQPLIEFRIPIHLEIMELDYIARGAKDPVLDEVRIAAEKAARAEDSAIFNGYKEAGIAGILDSSPHPPLAMPRSGADYVSVAVQAREVLHAAGVNGPYGLAGGRKALAALSAATQEGYPVEKRVQEILGGPIVLAPALEGMVVLSVRGGDFVLTVGQDLSVGFAHQEKHVVELYLTESFTFRVLEPAAAVALRAGKA